MSHVHVSMVGVSWEQGPRALGACSWCGICRGAGMVSAWKLRWRGPPPHTHAHTHTPQVPGWVVGASTSATGRYIPAPKAAGIWDPMLQ